MNEHLNRNQDSRYFRLASFYLAAFLFAKGLELVNIEREANSKSSHFVFRDTPERENLVQTFNYATEDSSEVMIDPRKFVTAIKTLKDRLYQERF